MAPTPEVLQKKFQLPPELGTRAVPRVFFAFQGERPTDKRMMLGTLLPALMSGALPTERQSRKRRKRVRQDELARRGGLRWRSSYTRRLSRFAPVAESERRRHERAPLEVFERSRTFARPNRMALFALPERQEDWAVVETRTGHQVKRFMSQQRASAYCQQITAQTGKAHQVEAVQLDPQSYHAPSIDQLAGDARSGRWWNQAFDSEGFKVSQLWVWNDRIEDPDEPGKPLDVTARLVMEAYQHFGLLDEIRQNGAVKPRGILHVHQQTVANYIGCSIRSVYRANQKWARLGILRIAHEREQQDDGWTSGPQIVIYLPMRQLTVAEADQERRRLQERTAEIVKREGLIRRQELERATRLHQELLEAWQGKEHSLRAFWNEVCRRMVAAGIAADIITYILPARPPE